MKRIITPILSFFILITALSCNIKNEKTTLEIEDNNRHYYPILQGQELEVVFPIKNIGENTFILKDIITSCGCLIPKSSINAIPAGEEARLFLTYNSNKNIGYVKHYITLYGNFADTNKIELTFDVRVVPDAHYTKDYEELYQEEKNKAGNIEDMVDGNENNKGYYLDENFTEHHLSN
ncbi:hypothetical protein GGR32_000738 [Mesonia hippocampi]|uniref:DUF1573 domain-containing protein n=1 Tax=Mesonia hippocampi TaxID=1628250 RepID=A0A840EWL8_9FLAO|nr:DUF1573 domain-containing protein [Mesonia hippocampi]MBB4118464.1 hypothetical protein [Mesonia hippocampi]